jgi:mono/diheme cytochrome c family protein
MSTRNWMVRLAGGLLVLGLISACTTPNPQPIGLTPIPTLAGAGTAPTLSPVLQVAGQTTSGSNTVGTGQADAAAGSAIFFKNCTTCHGAQGEGVSAPALRDSQYIKTGSDQDIFATIAQGRPGTAMPAWLQANGGPLTADQIQNAVAYLHSLQGVAPLPTATPLPPEPTETPGPANAPTPEPAQPSNAGEPGPAATLSGNADSGRVLFGSYCAACHGPQGALGVPNPGSDDGSVPPLNPIDSTLLNADPKVSAANIDLFVEHGSVPSGDNPQISMPAFGDGKLLTSQQIADIIAYIISLNTGK